MVKEYLEASFDAAVSGEAVLRETRHGPQVDRRCKRGALRPRYRRAHVLHCRAPRASAVRSIPSSTPKGGILSGAWRVSRMSTCKVPTSLSISELLPIRQAAVLTHARCDLSRRNLAAEFRAPNAGTARRTASCSAAGRAASEQPTKAEDPATRMRCAGTPSGAALVAISNSSSRQPG
jgi:hypothetical protein